MKKKIILMIAIILLLLIVISISEQIINHPFLKKSQSKYDVIEEKQEYSMEIEENSITPTSLTCKIYNHTNEDTAYGVSYEIETFVDHMWKSYEVQASWIDIAVILKANSSNTEQIRWKEIYGELSSGQYRLVKYINNIVVSDEFYITK